MLCFDFPLCLLFAIILIPRVAGKQLIGLKSVFRFVNAKVTIRFADQPVCTTVWKTNAFYLYSHLVCSYGLLGSSSYLCISGSVPLGESRRFPIEKRFSDIVQVGPGPCIV